MVIALSVIAVLLLAAVIFLVKFSRDMAVVESEIIKELREMKGYLAKMSQK